MLRELINSLRRPPAPAQSSGYLDASVMTRRDVLEHQFREQGVEWGDNGGWHS